MICVSYTLRIDQGVLFCTLTTDDCKQKTLPILPRGTKSTDLVLWVSEEEFIPVAQKHFEEIERDMQRRFPESELRLCFD